MNPSTQTVYQATGVYGPDIGIDEPSACLEEVTACPFGMVPDLQGVCRGDTYEPVEPPDETCPASGASTSHPIIPASGEKVFRQADSVDQAPHPLTFERTYRTQWQISPQTNMGVMWGHNHSASLRQSSTDASGNALILQLPDGTQRRFARTSVSASWVNPSHTDRLTAATTATGAPAWRYTRTSDDSQWLFTQPTASVVGKLQSQRQREGWTYTYTYNAAGQLFQVRNQFNRTLELTYHASGLLATVKAPDNKVTSYTWDDATARLMRVTYPDTKFIKYHYEDTRFPQYITGITDENDKRYQTVTYDSRGRAEVSTLAGDADKYSVNYNGSISAFNTGATITDPIGTTRTFGYSQTNGHTDVVNGSNLPGCKGEPPIASRNQNATTGLLERETDFRGNITQYTWDNTRQLIKSVTRALGTADQQVTSIDWHATLALPSLITEPLKKTNFDYYPDGRLQKVTVTHTGGETPDKVQITQYTYTAFGLLETLTEPNNAVTTYSNHNSAGLPQTITKPLNQVTTVTYDDMGRPKHIVQPDGLVRDLDYEDRGWLKLSSETANGVTLTTQYSYINSGQLKTVTYPSGYVITFTHDDAQRVKGWTDNRGQGATYVLDGLGNIRTETVTNSGGVVARKVVRDINAINRLSVQTFGDSVATTYGYDANGQLASIKDAANRSTNLGRDAMTRVSTITNALQKEAKYSYNTQDAVLTAKDFNGVTTVYKPDAQNQPAGETSPDRGSSGASYDALNLPASVTDAMGRATVITRDLLGRPTLITQSAAGTATLSTELRYDLSGSGCNAVGHPNASKGRLCEVITKVGTAEQTTERYQWDSFGRLTRQEQVLSTAIASHHQTLTTLYSYQDSGGGKGERATMTYPSGAVLTYQYDITGRLSGLLWNGLPLIENLKFNAVGQPLSWTWAFADTNSATTLSATRGYDRAGFLLTSEFGTFTPNSLGQISAITQNLYQRNAAGAWVAENVPHTATYEDLGRLKTFTAAGTSTEFKRALAYDWDDNGNRKLATFSEAGILRSSAASVIGTGSNRLERLSSYVQATNAAGEHLQLDSLGLAYDNAGRLSRTTQSEPVTGNVGVRKPYTPYAPATHFYNGLNQRVLRENPLGQTVYVYGSDGHTVLGEYQPSTSTSVRWSNGLSTEHIWLPTASGPMPVAAVINGEQFAVHADHLNTPRRLTDKSGTVRWQWAYSGFGEVAAQSLATATLPEVRFNLRYPGQVDDGNGLFYNWNRFYHPATGRYTKADPIGLGGGWNRFGYVGANPLSYEDPNGLAGRGPAQPSPQTALEQAIIRGDIKQIQTLVEAGETLESDVLTQCIARRSGSLVRELKEAGRGAGARSGQHGTPFKQAGSQMVREGNQVGGQIGQAMKDVGTRLIDKGNSINH